jgi:hypothetical protein
VHYHVADVPPPLRSWRFAMTHDLLAEAHRAVIKCLESGGGDFSKLPQVMKTFLLVYSAQGILDNGALQYFFESDWPGQPAYAVFSEAYRRIGADDCAAAVDRAVESLALDHPELNAERRQQRMEELWNDGVQEFADLSGRLCGDKSVLEKLSSFVENHREILFKA